MKKTAIGIGLVSGTLIVLYSSAISMYLGDFSKLTEAEFAKAELFGFLRYFILIFAVWFAIQSFKKQVEGPQAFMTMAKQGLKVTLVVALMVGVWETVYVMMHPDFYEKYTEVYLNQVKANGANEKAILAAQNQLKKFQWMKNPFISGLFYCLETGMVGAAASFIFGMFGSVRKRDESQSAQS